jgi:hypothetical protein
MFYHHRFFVVFAGLGFELRTLCKGDTHKTGTLLLEPHILSILVWLFWRWGFHEVFAQVGLELPSSQPQSSNQLDVSHWHPAYYHKFYMYVCTTLEKYKIWKYKIMKKKLSMASASDQN